MPGPHQIAAHVLDRSGQVAELLVGDRGNEREPQLAGREQPRQPDRVPPIRLHVIGRALRDRPGRNNLERDPRSRAARANPKPVGPASYTACT